MLASLLYLSNNSITKEALHKIEVIPYDIRLKQSLPIKENGTPPIVVIDIDEASLKRDGRWPWSRKKISDLIDRLFEKGVAVVAMDIVHSEAEVNPATQIKETLEQSPRGLPDWFDEVEKSMDADAYFANAMKDKELVLGFPFHHTLETEVGNLPPSTVVYEGENIKQLTAIDMQGYTANLIPLTTNAAASGFFSIAPDPDGSVRRASLVVSYKDKLYPSLALEAARTYLIEDSVTLHSKKIGDADTISHLTLGQSIIRTDAHGQILIPYLGTERHFTYLSASEILHDNKQYKQLENAIVFIGTSAVGLVDLRPTPVQSSYPGVEIQATILHAILHPETIVYNPDWTAGAIIAWLVLLGIIMTIIYPLLQPISLVVVGVVLFILTYVLNYQLWSTQQINLPVVMPLLLILAVSGIHILYGMLKENKERKRIHSMFGQYVPVGHIDRLMEDNSAISMDGDRREMSVLFSDIRSFTAISEHLTTQQLKGFLNHYLTPITSIIFNQQGTIDKYIGDLVMAFWGAPLHDPQHAENAVLAALKMRSKTEDMQDEFRSLGLKQEVRAGIGVHSGEMNVGDMGSTYRRAYTVLGDAVNLGSRLESLTKQYGILILVSEETMKQCPSVYFRAVDHVRVKGRQEPVRIFEPICLREALTSTQEKLAEAHSDALDDYLTGDWQSAHDKFTALLEQNDDPLHGTYLKRMQQFDIKSPNDWDGVFTHTSK